MSDGFVQVPPDSTGQKVDAGSLVVAGVTVIRQRITIADNSGSAQFATVTNNALLVQLNAGAANIGTIDGISKTVAVAWATPQTLDGISKTVNVAGTFTIGTIDKISATATVAISNFVDGSGNNRNVVDSANLALRVNIVAGAAAGVSQTDDTSFSATLAVFAPIGGVYADAGAGQSVSASHAGAVRMTGARALHVNIRDVNGSELGGTNALRTNCAGFIDGSGQNRIVVDSANLALRVTIANATATVAAVIGAGTSNIGTINNISATVNVAVATPFTVNNISRTVSCVITNNITIDFISATVTVTTANPYVLNTPSVSHGPLMVVRSVSATATLIAAPGAGLHVYVTMLAVTNGGTNATTLNVGSSASLQTVNMYLAAGGGGYVINFDPPWKNFSNEAVLVRVKPNTGGNCFINSNFYVAP